MNLALVFDIDNTLTPPRRPLNREMAEILVNLMVPFYVVSGSDRPLVQDQFLAPLHKFGFRGEIDAFLCNGATRYRCTFSNVLSVRAIRDFDFRDYLGEANFNFLLSVLEHTLKMDEFRLPPPMVVIGEQIIFRHSMVNVAPIGRPKGHLTDEAYRNRDAFISYDQRTGFRHKILAYLNRELLKLRQEKKLSISLGGQTSFDIVIEGNDKSYALRTLLDEGFKHLIFFGDALFEGGNDEAIMRYITNWPNDTPCPIQAIQVGNWEETKMRLQEMGVVELNQ